MRVCLLANNEIHINYHLGYEKAIKFAIMTVTEGVIRPTKNRGAFSNCQTHVNMCVELYAY